MISETRNPDWSRDELILALDLYFQHPPSTISKTHPAIRELSGVLNSLGASLGRRTNEKFRNTNGVYMKMCNFLRLDPSYSGKGLKAGGKEEELVWEEYAGDRTRLSDTARAIKLMLAPSATITPTLSVDEEEEYFPEGALLYRTHVARERSRTLVTQAKARAKRKHGRLICEVCGFDFAAVYGAVGDDYIECHHTLAVSKLSPGSKVKVADLALLCSNCHSMVHRRRPWLTMPELKKLLRSNGQTAEKSDREWLKEREGKFVEKTEPILSK